MVDTNSLKLNLERIDHWLSKGAQPSDTVRALITKFRGAAESAGAEA
jgi:ribosomal protein S16